MSKLKYTDEFLRIAEHVETMKTPQDGLYAGKILSTLNIPVTYELDGNYRAAVSTTINNIPIAFSYFDYRLDPAVRPLLFCFLHAILSSGDSLV